VIHVTNDNSNPSRNRPIETPPDPISQSLSGAPVYSTKNLFGSTNEIGIEHEGFFYRLRITKQRKLILYK